MREQLSLIKLYCQLQRAFPLGLLYYLTVFKDSVVDLGNKINVKTESVKLCKYLGLTDPCYKNICKSKTCRNEFNYLNRVNQTESFDKKRYLRKIEPFFFYQKHLSGINLGKLCNFCLTISFYSSPLPLKFSCFIPTSPE